MTNIGQTIAEIEKELSSQSNFFPPGTEGYLKITTSYYWTSSEENPACVFQPATPRDVSLILTALAGADPTVVFAIKGGGHIAPPGFNSTNGILVDMALFKQVVYNHDTMMVDVGPGLVWEDVYKVLNPLGRNVAGASTCQNVGVAGFNLGGGYSNKTNQFGLAIDSIKAIDVVLPTGEIVTADADHNQDIFWSLKGGGNNFGIVTNWTMVTHTQGSIFSQTLLYDPQHFEQLIPVIIEFSRQEVPRANVEAIFEFTLENGQPTPVANIECFYDGPVPPPGLFDGFLAIPHTVQTLVRTWADRQHTLPRNRQTYRVGRPSGVDDLPPFRGRFSCVMVSHYTPALIQLALQLAMDNSNEFVSHGGLQIYPDIWPFLPSIFDNSPESAWPHRKGHPNGPLVINFKWVDQANDSFWLHAIDSTTRALHALALKEGCTTEDAPVYYNLALENTPVSDIYRENMPQLISLRQKYDPLKVINRTGGFRIQ